MQEGSADNRAFRGGGGPPFNGVFLAILVEESCTSLMRSALPRASTV